MWTPKAISCDTLSKPETDQYINELVETQGEVTLDYSFYLTTTEQEKFTRSNWDLQLYKNN